jgi:phage-related tail fiber protein
MTQAFNLSQLGNNLNSSGQLDATDGLYGVLPIANGGTGSSLGAVPQGVVLYFATNTAPTGYLKANGAAISRTTYANLYAVIGTSFGSGDGVTTFNLPDLRGEFIRAWDDGRGIDSGRVFGSVQLDAFQGHWHQRMYSTNRNVNGDYDTSLSNTAENMINDFSVRDAVTDNVNGTPRTASETRPRNMALLACIKF